MSQTTLDDEDLFGEAAEEMRADVEDHLASARAALPTPDQVWDVEADNTLGVLNALRTALDVEDAAAHLRDAKKWYTIGERAEAFDDPGDLESEIEEIEDLLEELEGAHDAVGDLASTIPALRSTLEEVHADGETAEAESGDEAGTESGDAAGEEEAAE